MTGKAAELYRLVLDRILQVMRESSQGAEPAVRLVISDYEEAILTEMERAFPGARSRGYWFHFGQAIYRKACSFGLQVAYRANGSAVNRIVKLLISLALLPADQILNGLMVRQQLG